MDTTEQTTIVLEFDRTPDGTHVATHQGVAAIVHPGQATDEWPGFTNRWTLAGQPWGDDPDTDRPHGAEGSRSAAMGHAAAALADHLGVVCAGFTVKVR